jgi:predicted O-methyltransferase YrrM
MKTYKDIDGWFDWEELYDHIASQMKDGWVHVEVGVWQGKSVCYLADKVKKLNKKCKIYAVDWFKGSTDEPELLETAKDNGGSVLSIFKQNLKDLELEDIVIPVESDSAEAADMFKDEAIPSVYIDANHSYEGVTRDLQAWWPKVAKGGCMFGHDICEEQVSRAVYHFNYRVDKHMKVHRIYPNNFGMQKANS